MGLPTNNNKNNYLGNGNVSSYDYNFKIRNDEEIKVTVADTDGIETVLVYQTDYTVTDAGETSGGSIELVDDSRDYLELGTANLKQDYKISLRRNVNITQGLDIRNQGAYFPEVHEDAFDFVVMQNQQQQDEVDRSLKFPETVGDTDFDPTLPANFNTPGMVLAINEDGNGFINGPTVGQIEDAASASIDINAAAAAATTATDAAAAANLDATDAAASAASIIGDVALAQAARTGAETAATNATADALLAAADVVTTNADVVLTNADVVSTGNDATSTAGDVTTTAAAMVASAASAAAALISENNAAQSAIDAANAGSGGATNLDELSDVDLTTTAPVEGDVLAWDSASSTFLPGVLASGVALDDDNVWTGTAQFNGDVRVADFTIGGRQSLNIVGLPPITSVGTINRVDTYVTNWAGYTDGTINGTFRESTDADRITGNNMVTHIIRNSSTTATLTLEHGKQLFSTTNPFDCPGNKDLILPPNSQAIMMLDGSQRWEVIATSGYSAEVGSLSLNGSFNGGISGWTFSDTGTAGSTATYDSASLSGAASLNIDTSGPVGGSSSESLFSHNITASSYDLDNGFLDVEFDFRAEGDAGGTDKNYVVRLTTTADVLVSEYIFGGEDVTGVLAPPPSGNTLLDTTYKVKARLATDPTITSYKLKLSIVQAVFS